MFFEEALSGAFGEEQQLIAEVGMEVVGMLLRKNQAYGSSALAPIRVFSDLEPEQGIRIRMDDKISRIKNGAADDDEDPVLDLVGYGLLLLCARRKKAIE